MTSSWFGFDSAAVLAVLQGFTIPKHHGRSGCLIGLGSSVGQKVCTEGTSTCLRIFALKTEEWFVSVDTEVALVTVCLLCESERHTIQIR